MLSAAVSEVVTASLLTRDSPCAASTSNGCGCVQAVCLRHALERFGQRLVAAWFDELT